MPRPRHEVDEVLQAVYDDLPAIPECKGKCWISCGPVGMSDRERQRLRQAGFRLPHYTEMLAGEEDYWCPVLGPDGRCQAYSVRPFLCRAWGAVEGLKCPYGCVPEGGWLPDGDMRELIAETVDAGGGAGMQQEMAEARDALARHRARGGDRARAARYGDQLPEAVTKRKPPKVRR